jgi:hypothetical protein
MAVWVLTTGFVAALLTWHYLGHWLALAAGVITLAIACVVYRIEAPRSDTDRSEERRDRQASSAERIDQ